MHDMGDALASHKDAPFGKLWRTPPLWGIGVQKGVVPGVGYLHDGRARTLTEAILWHGGEAEYSASKFRALNEDLRRDLLNFISSL